MEVTSGLHGLAPYLPLPVLQHADSATTLRQAGVNVEQAIADATARDAEGEGDATAAPVALRLSSADAGALNWNFP